MFFHKQCSNTLRHEVDWVKLRGRVALDGSQGSAPYRGKEQGDFQCRGVDIWDCKHGGNSVVLYINTV